MGQIKNILITGSNGQLGKSLKDISSDFDYKFYFESRDKLDITDFLAVKNFLIKFKIDIIINCAAFTNVDKAESESKKANTVNNKALDNLAKLCNLFSVQLIHISTDYVFDGYRNSPYKETDKVNPISKYGKTKLEGEKTILKYRLKNSIIIRTSWLYSEFGNNFVNKILGLAADSKCIEVVNDEVGSPTYAVDLARVILEIIPKISGSKTEIYHYSNTGFCSRFEFAEEIIKYIPNNLKIIPVSSKKNKQIRPKYSVLDTSKISNKFKLKINDWSSGLEFFLKSKKLI